MTDALKNAFVDKKPPVNHPAVFYGFIPIPINGT